MKSPITNGYDPQARYPKLQIERAWVYTPASEWTYSHHQSIAFFRGRFYAIWSNGRASEDDVGQRVLISSSPDFHTWSAPVPLIDSQPGKRSERVLTAGGLHVHGGTLTAYYGEWEYCFDDLENGIRIKSHARHQDVGLRAVTSSDGQNWSRPLDLKLPMVPNHGPQRLASGRLLLMGNISFPWSDDPSGLSGWKMSGLYPADMAARVVDDPMGFREVQARMGWRHGLCESSFYQTADGVVQMLLRGLDSGRLWHTQSRDDGESWSAPLPTDFTDNDAKFHFGRLPDGRFYYVGNPDPTPPPNRVMRNPLVLSLSNDGVRFDRHFVLANEIYEMKREGLRKGGQYSYPHTLVHDRFLYVIVARKKEAVQALRVPLSAL